MPTGHVEALKTLTSYIKDTTGPLLILVATMGNAGRSMTLIMCMYVFNSLIFLSIKYKNVKDASYLITC